MSIVLLALSFMSFGIKIQLIWFILAVMFDIRIAKVLYDQATCKFG